MKESPSLIVTVDVETTGLDPFEHSIIELGAVELFGQNREHESRCQMWDGAKIDEEALRINGRSPESCLDLTLPTEGEAVELFLDWCDQFFDDEKLVLAGMNPRFDLCFLRCASRRHSTELAERFRRRFTHRTLDLFSLAVAEALRLDSAFPVHTLNTDAVYELLDMSPEPKPHVAIIGARMESQALRELLEIRA